MDVNDVADGDSTQHVEALDVVDAVDDSTQDVALTHSLTHFIHYVVLD